MGWAAGRWRLYGLALRELGRSLPAAFARAGRGPRWRIPRPERLLFAPQDLRTADATYAQDVADGVFVFAGRTVEIAGRSPFSITPPSPAWSDALFGFAWLRHHKANGTPAARETARALVADAIGPHSRRLEREAGRNTPVLARRVISFLCQSPLLLNGADHAFYERFLRSLGRGVASLERDAASARNPLDRLLAATALSYAALCCSGLENRLRRATRMLSAELNAQILTDGGHVSRNPGVLIDLLLDLLPLRLLYKSRGIAAPEALGLAVDRMMPMLRFLRHGSGELALFNGMGATAIDNLATLLSYDVLRPLSRHGIGPSGYVRLDAAGTLVIADVGEAPPLTAAGPACAGCLAFELSSGRQRLVVNAGIPRSAGAEPTVGRRTADHSTLGLGGISSALFLNDRDGAVAEWLEERLGPVLIAGPGHVTVEMQESDGADETTIVASHDGYVTPFGLRHARTLRLASDGTRLDGTDRLLAAGESAASAPDALIRFHLHPAVRASLDDSSAGATLDLPGGERWRFAAEGGELTLADSTYYGGADGWHPTRQLVVRVAAEGRGPISWRFVREQGRAESPPPAAASSAASS